MNDNRIRDVVILGGGTAGWMTAAALARVMARSRTTDAPRIHLVESEAIGTVGVGESTIPTLRNFNLLLDVNEADFMRQTQATFKLGIEFRDWGRIGDSYIHSFATYGRPLGGVPFHHHWLRLRALGDDTPIDSYSLPITAAHLGRFSRPPDPAASSVFPYAFQFDASLYAVYLRRYAEARGVIRTEGKVIDVDLNSADGFINSLTLENGARIDGDLFIDCSGFRSLLMERALNIGYDDWTQWLPCDRSVVATCERAGSAEPFTRAIASEAGWRWRIPLQHRVGNGYVYCGEYLSDAEARDVLLNRLEGAPLAEPRILRFTTGRRRKHWYKNCVAVGLSAGFLEPLESTSIGLIILAIFNLIQLFPDCSCDLAEAVEFNRLMDLEFERVRDFLVLHYFLTSRDDTPFWNHCRTMAIPDTLRHKLELFGERGLITVNADAFFGEPSWLSVCIGQNVVPRRYDPLSDTLDADEVRRQLFALRRDVRKTAEAMPLQDAFLKEYCAAEPPAGTGPRVQ
ncbi:MAG: tryptophan 7-halogenase [Alphaproteobacteria bacterium]|nr:tryptophan 7-halogenase [Alphaproteobacteria bacterium]MDE2265627.1 tryptophan 7-halogenase [Alphaproteobacteria bacterium]